LDRVGRRDFLLEKLREKRMILFSVRPRRCYILLVADRYDNDTMADQADQDGFNASLLCVTASIHEYFVQESSSAQSKADGRIIRGYAEKWFSSG